MSCQGMNQLSAFVISSPEVFAVGTAVSKHRGRKSPRAPSLVSSRGRGRVVSRGAHVEQRKEPKQDRSTVTVECILVAAVNLLEHEGLPGFNTNAIAEAAGVSIGSLYQFFPNKDAIMAALLLREGEKALDTFRATVNDTLDLPFSEALLVLLRRWRRDMPVPQLLGIFLVEEYRLPTTPRLRDCNAQLEQTLCDFLGAHIRVEACTKQELAEVTQDVSSIMRGMLYGAATRGQVGDLSLERRVVRAVVGYLSPLM